MKLLSQLKSFFFPPVIPQMPVVKTGNWKVSNGDITLRTNFYAKENGKEVLKYSFAENQEAELGSFLKEVFPDSKLKLRSEWMVDKTLGQVFESREEAENYAATLAKPIFQSV